jgi:cobalamin biosynthesis Mg chelatase CobN
VAPAANADRVEFVADLACGWARSRHRSGQTRLAIVLANYPNRDGAPATAWVPTPAGTIGVLRALKQLTMLVTRQRTAWR